MLRSLGLGLSQAVQECGNASVPPKTEGGVSLLSIPKSAPSALMCPVILCKLWLSWPVTQTLVQSIRVGMITLAHSHSYTAVCAHMHVQTCTCSTINPQTEMHGLTVPGGTEKSQWLMLGGLIHWIIQVQQMRQAAKCHWYPAPFLV